jgi:hypothetical protein
LRYWLKPRFEQTHRVALQAARVVHLHHHQRLPLRWAAPTNVLRARFGDPRLAGGGAENGARSRCAVVNSMVSDLRFDIEIEVRAWLRHASGRSSARPGASEWSCVLTSYSDDPVEGPSRAGCWSAKARRGPGSDVCSPP